MSQLSRTGVSIEEGLLKEFDRLIAKRGYQNRSEAFRDLIRQALLTETVDSNKQVVGTLTLVYDHHVPNLSQKLTETQHVAGAMILAATHVHLDHHYCLEVIIMKGRTKEIQGVADRMLALRGVELGKLVLTIRSSSRPCTFMVVPKALTTREMRSGAGAPVGPIVRGISLVSKSGLETTSR
jgi:CopG family nickel-responsive transcriptional regulator